jgi:hypothetical protein
METEGRFEDERDNHGWCIVLHVQGKLREGSNDTENRRRNSVAQPYRQKKWKWNQSAPRSHSRAYFRVRTLGRSDARAGKMTVGKGFYAKVQVGCARMHQDGHGLAFQ